MKLIYFDSEDPNKASKSKAKEDVEDISEEINYDDSADDLSDDSDNSEEMALRFHSESRTFAGDLAVVADDIRQKRTSLRFQGDKDGPSEKYEPAESHDEVQTNDSSSNDACAVDYDGDGVGDCGDND